MSSGGRKEPAFRGKTVAKFLFVNNVSYLLKIRF